MRKILSFDWALWFFWIMATTWGWLLTALIWPELRLVIAGMLVGVFQWLVLQGRFARPWHWIIVTSLGWLLGYFITLYWVPSEPGTLTGLTLGLTTGIAQWIVLRRELHWAGWWIIFSIMGWVTGLNLMPGFFLTGTMAGALTGVCLEILLRNPKPRPAGA
jgi:hypothetical protein